MASIDPFARHTRREVTQLNRADLEVLAVGTIMLLNDILERFGLEGAYTDHLTGHLPVEAKRYHDVYEGLATRVHDAVLTERKHLS